MFRRVRSLRRFARAREEKHLVEGGRGSYHLPGFVKAPPPSSFTSGARRRRARIRQRNDLGDASLPFSHDGQEERDRVMRLRRLGGGRRR